MENGGLGVHKVILFQVLECCDRILVKDQPRPPCAIHPKSFANRQELAVIVVVPAKIFRTTRNMMNTKNIRNLREEQNHAHILLFYTLHKGGKVASTGIKAFEDVHSDFIFRE